MGATGFDGSFTPIVQHKKWEIHPVFPHFPYFRSGQNFMRYIIMTDKEKAEWIGISGNDMNGSIKRFKEKYKARIGECYVIHPRNLTLKDDIVCIPPYMTICL